MRDASASVSASPCSAAARPPRTRPPRPPGYLVEWGSTAVLLDVGQGVIRNLQRVLDPHDLTAIVIGHMHADHYLDIVGLRYLYPWGEPARGPAARPPAARRPSPARRPGRRRSASGSGSSTRPSIAVEYDPDAVLDVGRPPRPLRPWPPLRPGLGGGRRGAGRVAPGYTGDTGPSDAVVEAVRGADLLLIEAALREPLAFDDHERGHLTPEEALELARAAAVRSALLVHYAPAATRGARRPVPRRRPMGPAAVDGLTVTVSPVDVAAEDVAAASR